jgi:multimeric flavodoxin WrbA
MIEIVLISGSARNDGDSQLVINYFKQNSNWRLLDLSNYHITPYDYAHLNKADDFLPLIKDILLQQKTIVFLTPVYWYAMSGQLKVFIDRFTDLITIEKEWGRKLKGMGIAVITTSNGNNLGEAFWLPFTNTADYLGMKYLGNLHTINGVGNLQEFQKLIEGKTQSL